MNPFMFQNLQATAIKKYLFEILKEKYSKNEKFIERLTYQVNTKEDFESFGIFVTDIFESGFFKAFEQYKENFEKLGMKVNIVAEEKPKEPNNNKIFNQSEKSG